MKIPDDYRKCPVCQMCIEIVTYDPDFNHFDQASIEMDLHPDHRAAVVKGVMRNPEFRPDLNRKEVT